MKGHFSWSNAGTMSKILRQIISTSKAPRPLAPYNQAVKVENMVFLSGVLGMDKTTNQLVKGSVTEEAHQLFSNLAAILTASGSGVDKLVKTTIMLNDINDFGIVNDVYKEYITENFPARSTYQVGKLPLGARIEVEAIGLCGDVITEIIKD